MTWDEIEFRFKFFNRYMEFYVTMLPHTYQLRGGKFNKNQIPEFDEVLSRLGTSSDIFSRTMSESYFINRETRKISCAHTGPDGGCGADFYREYSWFNGVAHNFSEILILKLNSYRIPNVHE